MAQSTVSAGQHEGAEAGVALNTLRRIGAHLAPWLAPLAILLAWNSPRGAACCRRACSLNRSRS